MRLLSICCILIALSLGFLRRLRPQLDLRVLFDPYRVFDAEACECGTASLLGRDPFFYTKAGVGWGVEWQR